MATPQEFYSLVFPSAQQESAQTRPDLRDAFHDLFLEPIFAAAFGAFLPRDKPSLYVVNRADEDAPYRADVLKTLQALFGSPLVDLDVVRYRQDVLRDLQQIPVLQALQAFQRTLRTMRDHLRRAETASNAIEGQRWFVDAALAYGQALDALHQTLTAADLQSQAMLALRQHIGGLLASGAHTACMAEAQALVEALAQVRYAIRIDGTTVTVLQDPAEPDYTAIIADTFARFRQGDVKDYRVPFDPASGLNHVEGQILDRVALLHPEVFGRLARFRTAQNDYADARILRLDRELPWFLCWIDFTQRFVRAGLPLCFPTLSAEPGHIDARDAYDMALARQCVEAQQPVVCNDFALLGEERMLVVTGPNHGGKTTLARTVGQLHHIASLGLPVAARSASLLLCDRLFTHFERVEDINNQRGKLQDDLVRMHRILEAATSHSLVLMNEIFSSTTLDDALWLARRIMAQLSAIGAACVFVTFLDELSTFDAHTVSMVGTVDAQDPTIRTFKVVRKPADGKSYALALAHKFGVTRDQLLQRITS
jgi:energy-coupling factor transporter ATP-binding protein EcfA2